MAFSDLAPELLEHIAECIPSCHDLFRLSLSNVTVSKAATRALWLYHVNDISCLFHLLPPSAYTFNKMSMTYVSSVLTSSSKIADQIWMFFREEPSP